MNDDQESRRETQDIFFHEDDHAKDRTDWFFIGHAILVEGFFSAASKPWAATAVGVVALLSGIAWLLVGRRQLRNLNELREEFKRISPTFAMVHAKRIARDDTDWLLRLGRASWLFLVGLPGLFCSFWLTAIGYSIWQNLIV